MTLLLLLPIQQTGFFKYHQKLSISPWRRGLIQELTAKKNDRYYYLDVVLYSWLMSSSFEMLLEVVVTNQVSCRTTGEQQPSVTFEIGGIFIKSSVKFNNEDFNFTNVQGHTQCASVRNTEYKQTFVLFTGELHRSPLIHYYWSIKHS